MERNVIDVDWWPVETATESKDKPTRAEWENNRTVAGLFLGALAFFAWAVTLCL